MIRLSALQRDERGSMAVETALILPVLLYLSLSHKTKEDSE